MNRGLRDQEELDKLILHGTDSEMREVITKLQQQVESCHEKIDELQAKLDNNKCNAGHETLPLVLWDCPECGRLRVEALQKFEKFVNHIQAHLEEGESVICKICGKTIEEIAG